LWKNHFPKLKSNFLSIELHRIMPKLLPNSKTYTFWASRSKDVLKLWRWTKFRRYSGYDVIIFFYSSLNSLPRDSIALRTWSAKLSISGRLRAVAGVVLLAGVVELVGAGVGVFDFLRRGVTMCVTMLRKEMTPRPTMTVIKRLLFCRPSVPVPNWNPAPALKLKSKSLDFLSVESAIFWKAYLIYKMLLVYLILLSLLKWSVLMAVCNKKTS